MDDELEFADLENELHRLRPRAPAAHLELAIAHRLAEPLRDRDRSATAGVAGTGAVGRRPCVSSSGWTSWKGANWAVAAGLVVLMAGLGRWQPGARPERLNESGRVALTAGEAADTEAAAIESRFRPVTARREILGSRPEEIVELDDGTPVRRVRDYFVDTIVWRDPVDGAELQWEVPRESVRFVGLSAY